ncbi:MAG: hypothetical protein EOP04_33305 [Proteobacteria bacterium]|nr:MAG: hypothetical protein EOP04_33305 [Pseudomonadota bacterium]
MRVILFAGIFGFTGMAFAGGQMGGGSPPALAYGSSLTVGDMVIELPVADRYDGFVLDESKMLDIIGGTMRRDPITLNGEAYTADRYEFGRGEMLLRSKIKPSNFIKLRSEIMEE